jgi:hypothetical protein
MLPLLAAAGTQHRIPGGCVGMPLFARAIGMRVPADMMRARLCVMVAGRRLPGHAMLSVPGTRMGMMPAASQHAVREHRRTCQEMNAAGKHADDTLDS